MKPTEIIAPRILVIDDNIAIHEDFRKILCVGNSPLGGLENELFDSAPKVAERIPFRVDSASQGQEALHYVEKAVRDEDPYTVAFVDVRMPPGWDGVETIERIWRICPEMQCVICTAYSDYSWDEITSRFGYTDNLLILKKPFESAEVLQLAHALTRKWALGRQVRFCLEDLALTEQQDKTEIR
ncbi:MAG TPA: response regulator [Verrucomicrobiae bacterium]|jgi:CheY-like chemotaxis protein|nr:response regulator [Verrucomicrobiae bacterium]